MANPVQWTVDQLRAQLGSLKAQFQAEWDTLGQNNQTVTDLYTQASNISDPATRSRVQQGLEAIASRQAKLQGDFNRAYGIFQSAYNGAAKFLNTIGVSVPDVGTLSGLGQVQVLVPVVVVGAVLLAAAWLAANHDNNATQQQLLAAQQQRVNAVINGQLSTSDYLAMSKSDTTQANQLTKPNPSDWTQMVIPALGLVALIVLGPRIMDALRSRRAAA